MGFVNCKWIFKGQLKNDKDSRVGCSGQTYDGKLYTFKETNFRKDFESLEILAEQLKDVRIQNKSESVSVSNLSSSLSESSFNSYMSNVSHSKASSEESKNEDNVLKIIK